MNQIVCPAPTPDPTGELARYAHLHRALVAALKDKPREDLAVLVSGKEPACHSMLEALTTLGEEAFAVLLRHGVDLRIAQLQKEITGHAIV